MDRSITGPAAGGARVLEECQVRSRRALLVSVEQVVDGRVVLVDGLLDHPQAKHPGVELDVLASVAGDGGDVVYALELHLGHHSTQERVSRAPRRAYQPFAGSWLRDGTQKGGTAIIDPCKTDRSSRALGARDATRRLPCSKASTPSSTLCASARGCSRSSVVTPPSSTVSPRSWPPI